MTEMMDKTFVIGFLTGVLFIKVLVSKVPFLGSLLNSGHALEMRNMDDDQSQKHPLRFLVVGRSKSGKRLTVKSFVQRDCAVTDSGNPGLTNARHSNSYGWNVYALVNRCFQASVCEMLMTSESAKEFFTHILNHKIHVVIYCFPFNERLTDEDAKFLDNLKLLLGSSRFKNNIILAMTFGEDFEEYKDKRGYTNFNNWLEEMDPGHLKRILKDCSYRCVMFKNKTEIHAIKKQQAIDLFSMAESVVWNNGLVPSDGINIHDDESEKQIVGFKLLENQNSKDEKNRPLTLQPGQMKRSQVIPDLRTLVENKMQFSSSSSNTAVYRLFSHGDQKYKMIQSYYCTLKENIRAEEFTDEMHQEGILSLEEKQDIDQMHGINKRKEALFDAIDKYRNNGSVDVFLKILEKKYPTLHESWKCIHGDGYDSITAPVTVEKQLQPFAMGGIELIQETN
ncbi:unnamed protein product [Lymnaea stagnalis]|uniref:AIG1-type G domain-containing protein n=1 Tax=Lymnaea stagnalis TaxID=6523 RepID=A0AAV2I8C2_LYMST